MTHGNRILCAMGATIFTTITLLSVDAAFLLGAIGETAMLV